MKVLVACEESQTVCKAFRNLGYDAYSCDIQDQSGGHPEWHIKEDALKVIGGVFDHDRRKTTLRRQVGRFDCAPSVHLFDKLLYEFVQPESNKC